MIIVDRALEQRQSEGRPIQVAIIGAGYIGRGMALQIIRAIPGMRVAVVANRTIVKAKRAFTDAGVDDFHRVESHAQLEDAITRRRYAVTDDASIACEAAGIDVVIEATGDVEYGAGVALTAIRNGKHIVMMNAETDATVGPVLNRYARSAGVVYTNADGDQPGVVMNLFRFVKTIGYRPVLAGNIKGMLDHYRTPETQRAFAELHKQDVKHITSFADGTKLAFEQAVIANATGFGVGRRGMYGPACDHVEQALDLFPHDEMLNGGLSDYVLGAQPGPGVFVIGYNEHPILRQYMPVFKMGEGPFYVFYTPYHLPHLEAPLTVARAALFDDAAITPRDQPVCEVVAVAKRDLAAGDVIDGIGGFTCYGTIDNAHICRNENLLPMGLAKGCRVLRPISKDQAIMFDDVDMPEERLADRLWREQTESRDRISTSAVAL